MHYSSDVIVWNESEIQKFVNVLISEYDEHNFVALVKEDWYSIDMALNLIFISTARGTAKWHWKDWSAMDNELELHLISVVQAHLYWIKNDWFALAVINHLVTQ